MNDVAYIATYGKSDVAIIARDTGSAHRYVLQMLSTWLSNLLKAREMSQAGLARALSESLGRAVDRSIVNKMCNGTRDISAYELAAILEIFDEFNPLSGRDLPKQALQAARLFAQLEPGRQDRILATIEDAIRSEQLQKSRLDQSATADKTR